MQIELYLWQGRWGPFRIKSHCAECDVNHGILRKLAQERPGLKLKVRPWLNDWWKVLFKHGVWHTPIVIINGKLHSQGVIIDAQEVRQLLA